MIKRDFKLIGNAAEVIVIADNEWDFNFQFSAVVPAQQIIQAVVITRNKDGHPGVLPAGMYCPLHIIGFGNAAFEMVLKVWECKITVFKITFQPHEKHANLHINMLVKIDYISPIGMYKTGNVTDDPGLIGTMYKQSDFQNTALSGPKIRC